MRDNNSLIKKVLDSCSPPRCSCATMELDFDSCMVEIHDDYNNIAKMSFDEMAILARKFLAEV